jgi:hypothetical protein
MTSAGGTSHHPHLTAWCAAGANRVGATQATAPPQEIPKGRRKAAFLFVQLRMSANGTKRHFAAAQQTVAFGGKADIENV